MSNTIYIVRESSWIGFRNGKPVAAFSSQQGADAALYRRTIESAAPVRQPGATPEKTAAAVAYYQEALS